MPEAESPDILPEVSSAGSGLTRSRVRTAWVFLSPMLIGLAFVAGWPLLRTIYFGFTDASLANMNAYQFVWFDNYLSYYEGE